MISFLILNGPEGIICKKHLGRAPSENFQVFWELHFLFTSTLNPQMSFGKIVSINKVVVRRSGKFSEGNFHRCLRIGRRAKATLKLTTEHKWTQIPRMDDIKAHPHVLSSATNIYIGKCNLVFTPTAVPPPSPLESFFRRFALRFVC